MKFAADKYYLYEEMKELLEGWAKQYPDVLRLFSIGQSWCGREIPAAALTLGGIEEEKPGVLFDGGIHSREFVGSSVVLYALFYFLDNYEKDEELHKILEEKTLYFIPRINVDGMEEDLLGKGNYRGSLKPFHEKEDGVYTTDIDGDGIIIKMRIPNENGEWRCSEEDPRLLVRRMPGDTKGPFYDVFDEGLVRGEVTTPLKASKLECDRDPNREFPFDWDRKTIGENYRYSAGNYPLEDAETRALADFIIIHNNIHTIVDEHSYMSAYISPMEFYKEKPSQPEDSMLMYEIGEAASEETGMMHANIFPLGLHGVAHGSFTPWAYFERGIAAWCCENWNIRYLYDTVNKEHPIKKMEPLMSPEEIFQTRLALLKWDDEENGSRAFVPWHTVSHPQLGEVEVGGFQENYVIWNPPADHLEEECKRSLKFIMRCIRAVSQLEAEEVRTEKIEQGYRIAVKIKNKGLFSSYGTRHALEEELTTTGTWKVEVTKNGNTLKKEEKLPEIYGGCEMEVSLEFPEGETGDPYTMEIRTERAGVLYLTGTLEP